MFKVSKPLLTTAFALAVCVPASLRAGTYTNGFTTDPSTTGHTLSGVAVWNSTGGNPGGFVQLTDAIDDQVGAILLPDFDHGTIISAFTVSMDVRVGAGTDTLPAEGWSINFVPATADVVTYGAPGPGWASDFASTPNVNQPSRGSTQGLGVYSLNWGRGRFRFRQVSTRFSLPWAAFMCPPLARRFTMAPAPTPLPSRPGRLEAATPPCAGRSLP